VGAREFYADGEPQICETLRHAVDGYGALFGVETGAYKNEYDVACCIERGFESPIPGLAVTAIAAARYPNCERRVVLDADDLQVYVEYRERDREQRSIWRRDRQGVPLVDTVRTEAGEELAVGHLPKSGRARMSPQDYAETKGRLQEGDLVALARVKARPNAYWDRPGYTVSFEQALNADTRQLRDWMHGRAIVIGHMRSGLDVHRRADGEYMFGCQVQADMIDALLRMGTHQRFTRSELLARNLLWCGIAVVLVSLLGVRNWRSLRHVTVVCLGLFAAGTYAGVHALRPSEWWLLEMLIAITGLFTAGSLTFWLKAVRERQLGLTPSAVTPPSEGPTLASTVLAETR
jgi:hypothetical protein